MCEMTSSGQTTVIVLMNSQLLLWLPEQNQNIHNFSTDREGIRKTRPLSKGQFLNPGEEVKSSLREEVVDIEWMCPVPSEWFHSYV